MSSPLPVDPYETLGVAKDADTAAIRNAYRKLALKHHPDRIKGTDLEREEGKNIFQQVQQAYELLQDDRKRARYDDRVKLAELQRERMMQQREQARRESRDEYRDVPRSARQGPPPTPSSSRRGADGHMYEDRAPPPDFFDRDQYDDHPVRASARKAETYEKKASAPRSSEKKDKYSKAWFGPADGISYNIASKLKERASETRERAQRQKQEVRDRGIRKERSAKQSSQRTAYVTDESETDRETFTPKSVPKPSSKPSKPASRTKADSDAEGARPRTSSRKQVYSEDDEKYEKWENYHRKSTDYIAQAQGRPEYFRSDSNASYHYWEGDARPNRRSADAEKRPSPPHSRRTTADDSRTRPSMPAHSSAPQNLRAHANIVDRGPPGPPPRSKTQTHTSERESRREPPPASLNRSQTMPVRSKKDGTAPSRGSGLRNSETTQDSGYESRTPEFRGDSPPQENSRRSEKSTKYAIVEPADDLDDELAGRGPRLNRNRIINDSDEERRFTRSPERGGGRDRERERDRDRERERERVSDRRPERSDRPRVSRIETDGARTRSVKIPASTPHYESQSPREGRRPLFNEIPVDEREPAPYGYRPDPASIRVNSYGRPTHYTTRGHTDYDYSDHSRFRQDLNHSAGSRQSAAT